MILELTKHDTVLRVTQQHDDQSTPELADIFFRMLLAAEFSIDDALSAYEQTIEKYEWARSGDGTV